MKLMFTGIFLAASAAPMAMFVGFFAFRSMRGGIPNALDMAGNTAACLVGLGLFMFLSGLMSKSDATQKAPAESAQNEK